MITCNSINEVRQLIKSRRAKGETVGLVPTMGYFHEGHLSLMRIAREECDFVVVSLFVNPTQFGPNEDFEDYPRDFDRDARLAQNEGVDAIFAPAEEEMYPTGFQTYVEVEEVTQPLCGESRPGHFRGVSTVVTKLFNIVRPDKAYFGQKDAQQAMVIKQMVKDLNMEVEIVTGPIIRESDGLAMSSRNVYLSQQERNEATILYYSLKEAEEKIQNGERNPETIRNFIIEKINSCPAAQIDYVEVLSVPDLKSLKELQGEIIIALAVWFGKTRLIDNTILEVF